MNRNIVFQDKLICPTKVICVGRNYVGHIKELGNSVSEEMVIFMKPPSAITKNIYHDEKDILHFEAEITLLIENKKIAGIGFGLDLTKREVQNRLKSQGLPWERAKSFDNSAVLSEFVPFNGDPGGLRLELWINNKLRQAGGCETMLYKPDHIVEEVASFLTLEDGDLIMTGTPEGVGPVVIGDKFVGKIFYEEKLLLETNWCVK